MLLSYALKLGAEALALESAVNRVLKGGHGTGDLKGASHAHGTHSLGERIREAIRSPRKKTPRLVDSAYAWCGSPEGHRSNH
jgi:hypothetical protein